MGYPKDTTIEDTTNSLNWLSNELNYRIYPNPTPSSITIQTKDNQLFTRIVIQDMSGKTAERIIEIENSEASEWQIDLPNSGTYLVQFWNRNTLLRTEKVIRLE